MTVNRLKYKMTELPSYIEDGHTIFITGDVWIIRLMLKRRVSGLLFVNNKLDGITVLLFSNCGRIIHTLQCQIIFN